VAAKHDDDTPPHAGYLALGSIDPTSVIRIKKIEIKELP
jgi:hypothetical protein